MDSYNLEPPSVLWLCVGFQSGIQQPEIQAGIKKKKEAHPLPTQNENILRLAFPISRSLAVPYDSIL